MVVDMKLKKFKEKNHKKIEIIFFTITCILLISGVILYRTFAIFQVDTTQNVINGSIEDPGDIYFAFYKDGNIQKEMPKKSDGYILDEKQSFCGINGTNADSIKVSMTEDEVIHVSGVATSRTKCNLYFVKGVYILGKGIPFETESDGLYEVKHDGVTGTINDTGFQQTEYRYAGSNPNNYIKFNNETWRIIGLVNVMTSETNVEQRVKIVKNESIGTNAWDMSNKNDWTKATLNTYLNEDYYNKLNNNAQSMIDDNVLWNLGYGNFYSMNVHQFYQIERGENSYNSNTITWKGNIGLIYPSDYGYATSGNEEGRNACLEHELYNQALNEYYDTICNDNNWLKPKENDMLKYSWTITSLYDGDNYVFGIAPKLSIYVSHGSNYELNTFPTLYLTTKVNITDGNGTLETPYQISLINKN